jgi:Tfp pilus assembly protein PilO
MNKGSGDLPNKLLKNLTDIRGNKLVIGAIVLFVFGLDVVILSKFQILPLVRTFSKAAQLRSQLAQAGKDMKSSSTYKTQLKILRHELVKLDERTTSEEDLPAVLEVISKFAEDSGVRILSLKPIASSVVPVAGKEDALMREKITLSLESGFHDLGAFMAMLENSRIYFHVVRAEIRAGREQKEAITIVLEVVLKKA